MPDFSIDVSHEVSREAVREQLPHLRPPLRLLAEELLAEESTIDFVTVDPAGHVALLLLGKEGEDASLLTRGLAHRAWVKARLEDWRQLAPDLGLAADANVSAVLLCPSFRPETLTAARPWATRYSWFCAAASTAAAAIPASSSRPSQDPHRGPLPGGPVPLRRRRAHAVRNPLASEAASRKRISSSRPTSGWNSARSDSPPGNGSVKKISLQVIFSDTTARPLATPLIQGRFRG